MMPDKLLGINNERCGMMINIEKKKTAVLYCGLDSYDEPAVYFCFRKISCPR
jgi:hypothetical protein